MRFNIQLIRTSKRSFLPFNYQYFISSWIYKRIAEADTAFADFLHQQGYGEGNRKFKLFCFGPLNIKPFRIHKERGVLELLGQEVSLEISFFLPKAAENFIKGLFMHQQLGLGDRINQVDFEVSRIESVGAPLFMDSMRYKALAPICISRPSREEEQHAQYLHPQDKEYANYLINNTIQKWMATCGVIDGNGSVREFHENGMHFKCLTREPKSQMITIKSFTPEQTKVRGYLYDFELIAPQEVHELVYAAGLGEKCSMGFGCLGISINKR
jgi:CRISPR-associated endoribonuclease Cas6